LFVLGEETDQPTIRISPAYSLGTGRGENIDALNSSFYTYKGEKTSVFTLKILDRSLINFKGLLKDITPVLASSPFFLPRSVKPNIPKTQRTLSLAAKHIRK